MIGKRAGLVHAAIVTATEGTEVRIIGMGDGSSMAQDARLGPTAAQARWGNALVDTSRRYGWVSQHHRGDFHSRGWDEMPERGQFRPDFDHAFIGSHAPLPHFINATRPNLELGKFLGPEWEATEKGDDSRAVVNTVDDVAHCPLLVWAQGVWLGVNSQVAEAEIPADCSEDFGVIHPQAHLVPAIRPWAERRAICGQTAPELGDDERTLAISEPGQPMPEPRIDAIQPIVHDALQSVDLLTILTYNGG